MKELLNEILMEDKTLIHFPFGNGFFDIYKSVVVSWGIIAFVFIFILFMTRDMKVHNISKRQAAVESFVLWVRGAAIGMLGEEGARYADYIATVLNLLPFPIWLVFLD